MQGVINIIGDIGETDTGVGVMLIDVMAQVKSQPQATVFDVLIESNGGDVFEGWKIANYIKTLPLTNAIGQNIVASIATVIFGSCTTREVRPNTKVMLHLPMGDMGGGGTADEIELFSKRVREEENKLCAFYSELMGFDKETIKDLISKDTYLTDEQSKAFGITTKEPRPITAKAIFNTNTNNNQMNKEDKSWIDSQFEKILNLIKPQIKNILLQDANGTDLDFPDIMEGEDVTDGAMAMVDGQPANGEYVMPSGETYSFTDGILTIVPVEEDAEDFEAKYNALKAEMETVTTAKLEAEKETEKQKQIVTNLAKEVKEFKSQITSKFKIDAKKDKKEEGDEPKKRTLLKKD